MSKHDNTKHVYGIEVSFRQISPEGDQYNDHSWVQYYDDHATMIEEGFAIDELLYQTLKGMMKQKAEAGITEMRKNKQAR